MNCHGCDKALVGPRHDIGGELYCQACFSAINANLDEVSAKASVMGAQIRDALELDQNPLPKSAVDVSQQKSGSQPRVTFNVDGGPSEADLKDSFMAQYRARKAAGSVSPTNSTGSGKSPSPITTTTTPITHTTATMSVPTTRPYSKSTPFKTNTTATAAPTPSRWQVKTTSSYGRTATNPPVPTPPVGRYAYNPNSSSPSTASTASNTALPRYGGTAATTTEPARRFCSQCGAVQSAGRFCASCGVQYAEATS